MYIEQIVIGSFVAMNLFTFFFMAYDKRKAIVGNDSSRVPEGLIFCLASVFGSLGVYAGMVIFRHKTRKWYFQIGIPLLLIQNLATLYLVREMLVH